MYEMGDKEATFEMSNAKRRQPSQLFDPSHGIGATYSSRDQATARTKNIGNNQLDDVLDHSMNGFGMTANDIDKRRRIRRCKLTFFGYHNVACAKTR